MNNKSTKWIFYLILTISIFSWWAAFALLVVNKLFYQDLPGYIIGRLCIWELIAIILAAIISKMMFRKWGNPYIHEVKGQVQMIVPPFYAKYFTVYFFTATLIGIWQFWLFSQKY